MKIYNAQQKHTNTSFGQIQPSMIKINEGLPEVVKQAFNRKNIEKLITKPQHEEYHCLLDLSPEVKEGKLGFHTALTGVQQMKIQTNPSRRIISTMFSPVAKEEFLEIKKNTTVKQVEKFIKARFGEIFKLGE